MQPRRLGRFRRARFGLGGAVAWLALLAAPKALAQPPASQSPETQAPVAPSQPVITPPTLIKDEGAQYPALALSEGFYQPIEVALRLTIDASGKVTHADVEKPVGHGFDEAAVEAAQRLVFEPAKRDGKPVASRGLRFVYRFTPPPA